MNAHPALLVSVMLAPLVVASAQDPSSAAGQKGFRGGVHISAPRFAMQVVIGAPYSGEQVMENDQSLADGTHIRHSTSMKVCRDSAGRVRAESPLRSTNPESQAALLMVHISDPVAHALYVLDSVNKVAHRQELPVSPTPLRPRPVAPQDGDIATAGTPTASQPPRSMGTPEIVDENLGTRSMEGLIVEGTRHTTIRPVGEMGNDHPMTEVDESWTSPELRLVVFRRRTGPLMGEQIDKLTNVGRSEPEAALFQIPPDYTVVDEHGDFTLTWAGR